MLFDLRDHLRRDGPQSLADLQARLGMPEPVVRDMLERWMAKGCVAKLGDGALCGRCCKREGCAFADAACLEVFAWVEAGSGEAGRANRSGAGAETPAPASQKRSRCTWTTSGIASSA